MDADFSIELGREDPVLDFPWKDPAGKLAYVDLKRQSGVDGEDRGGGESFRSWGNFFGC